MKVIHATTGFPGYGGRERFIELLVNFTQRLAPNITQTIISVVPRGRQQKGNKRGLRARLITVPANLSFGAYSISFSLMKTLLREGAKGAIVHCHGYGYFSSDMASFLARISSMFGKQIMTTHGLTGYLNALEARMCNVRRRTHLAYDYSIGTLSLSGFSWIVTQTLYEKKLLSRILRNSTNKVDVITPPVDPIFLGKHEEDRDVVNQTLVLYVGRIDPFKGVSILPDVIQLLTRVVPNAKLILIGKDWGAISYIRRKAKQLGVNDRILYLGYLDPPQLLPFYRKAVALVYPSSAEGMPLAVCEAMACGLPVVTIPRGPVAYEIKRIGAGLVSTGEDPESIATSLFCLVSDRDLRATLAENGIRFAARNCRPEFVASRYLMIYRSLSDVVC